MSGPSAAPPWIVCWNQTRSVTGGQVFCPCVDLVSLETCLACHFLEAVEDDRERGCGEIAALAPAPSPGEIVEPGREPNLMIELL